MLKRSKDRKVTNAVNAAGTTATGANSFGLPSGRAFSCPGATSICERVCYAGRLEKVYKGVRNVLTHNWDLLKDASLVEMTNLLDAMVQEFRAETDKAIAKGKAASYDFRIHWDGDFFSLDYAKAWAEVIAINPGVKFWVYTRSFTKALDVLPVFAGINRDNLALYLSVDNDNRADAIKARVANPWVKLAWLDETFADGKANIPSDKAYPCPENGKRIPLISEKGSACIRCGICPDGRGDVLFSIKKR